MKKILLGSTLLCSIFLAACNDNEEVTNKETESHNFTEFSLDVDYSATESYEASYDKENDDKLEASIEDDRNNKKLDGNKAYDELLPLLEKLKFDASTPDEQVIEEVIKVFNIDENYKEFDLDITFKDGIKSEYKHVK